MNVQPQWVALYDGDDSGSFVNVNVIGDYAPTTLTNPLDFTYCGIGSTLLYGSQSPDIAPAGTPCTIAANLIVRNNLNNISMHNAFAAYMTYATNTGGFNTAEPGQAWLSDCILSGAINKQQSALGGWHILLNDFYEGVPLDAPSAAY